MPESSNYPTYEASSAAPGYQDLSLQDAYELTQELLRSGENIPPELIDHVTLISRGFSDGFNI